MADSKNREKNRIISNFFSLTILQAANYILPLIILPFLAPVMMDLGVDMVWFIVMFAVVLQTSFITPPVGFALFYMKGVAPQGITIVNIYKGIIPFVILQVIAVTIVFNFPEIVTWLPKVAYGPN